MRSQGISVHAPYAPLREHFEHDLELVRAGKSVTSASSSSHRVHPHLGKMACGQDDHPFSLFGLSG